MGSGVKELMENKEAITSICGDFVINSVRHRRELRQLFKPDAEVKLCESCGEYDGKDWCEKRKGILNSGGVADCWRPSGKVLIWDEKAV